MRQFLPRAVLLVLLSLSVFGQRSGTERAAWNQPYKPFRVIGNVYYVGMSGVASFLITTPQGDILLDGGLPESAPLIEKNISALGFHLKDVKYLLNSHAHFDHAGGLAELKRLSGAQLIVSKRDSGTIKRRGPSMLAVAVDRVIDDNGVVQLGGTTLTAHLTPGHTPGCTTWTMPVIENGKTYNVVFFCSTTVAGNRLVHNRKYPQIVSDYEQSFANLRQLPCDVFLAPHGGFFHLDEKRALLAKHGPNPFINPDEFRAFIDESQKDFERELKRQRAASAK
jgi:metallo-beta-lactamase class B